MSNWVPFALPPSICGWPIFSYSQTVGDVCVDPCLHRKGGQALEKRHFPHHPFQPLFVSVLCAKWDHSLEALIPFCESIHGNTDRCVWKYTCLWEASPFLCPCTRFSGTCWKTVSYKEHKSYCPSTYTSIPQPERGQALCSKKSNNCLYRMSLILPGIGPGSEIYRQFVIFQKYFQNDLKFSQFNLICRNLLFP